MSLSGSTGPPIWQGHPCFQESGHALRISVAVGPALRITRRMSAHFDACPAASPLMSKRMGDPAIWYAVRLEELCTPSKLRPNIRQHAPCFSQSSSHLCCVVSGWCPDAEKVDSRQQAVSCSRSSSHSCCVSLQGGILMLKVLQFNWPAEVVRSQSCLSLHMPLLPDSQADAEGRAGTGASSPLLGGGSAGLGQRRVWKQQSGGSQSSLVVQSKGSTSLSGSDPVTPRSVPTGSYWDAVSTRRSRGQLSDHQTGYE